MAPTAILNFEKCHYLRGRLWASTAAFSLHVIESISDNYNSWLSIVATYAYINEFTYSLV